MCTVTYICSGAYLSIFNRQKSGNTFVLCGFALLTQMNILDVVKHFFRFCFFIHSKLPWKIFCFIYQYCNLNISSHIQNRKLLKYSIALIDFWTLFFIPDQKLHSIVISHSHEKTIFRKFIIINGLGIERSSNDSCHGKDYCLSALLYFLQHSCFLQFANERPKFEIIWCCCIVW